MEYVIVSDEPTARAPLVQRIEARGAVRSCARWQDVRCSADDANTVVVSVPPGSIRDGRWLRGLTAFRMAFPRSGVVLVLDLGSPSRLDLGLLPAVDAVVAPDADGTTLFGALDAAIVLGPVRELVSETNRLSDGVMRRAVVTLLRAQPPFSTVVGVAQRTEVSGNQLSHRWLRARLELGVREGVRLTDLVQWTLLARAVAEHRRTVRSWGEVATRFGVGIKVLSRSSRKFLEVTLRELDDLDSVEIASRARSWIRWPPA